MLNASFKLDCYPEIRDFVDELLSTSNVDDIYITRPVLPPHLLEKLNRELVDCGLPVAEAFVAFKRKNFVYSDVNNPPVSEIRGMHLDCNLDRQILNVSLILPVSGCEDTYMYYAGGRFDTRFTFAADGKTIRAMIDWQEEPYILDRVMIDQHPVLSRVDIPHDAGSRPDGEYRTTFTIRLRGNPSFEEVYSKFLAKDKIIF